MAEIVNKNKGMKAKDFILSGPKSKSSLILNTKCYVETNKKTWGYTWGYEASTNTASLNITPPPPYYLTEVFVVLLKCCLAHNEKTFIKTVCVLYKEVN